MPYVANKSEVLTELLGYKWFQWCINQWIEENTD